MGLCVLPLKLPHSYIAQDQACLAAMLYAVIEVSTASPLDIHLRYIDLDTERSILAALPVRSLRQPEQKNVIFLMRRNQLFTETLAIGTGGCALVHLQGTGGSVCR
jgi:hypothetical protein